MWVFDEADGLSGTRAGASLRTGEGQWRGRGGRGAPLESEAQKDEGDALKHNL